MESRLPVPHVSFLFSLCKVVSLLTRLKVARNVNIGCIIHMKVAEVS